jgi:hypothetical protein
MQQPQQAGTAEGVVVHLPAIKTKQNYYYNY